MVTITIDEKSYDVEAGKNLLEVCQSLGLEIPYFCWHPAMGSVGSCRQCAVTQYMPNDANRERGKIVMSCMTPVTDGLIVSLHNPQSKKFRSLTIEATMTNHPHDCPVCEEAGECHLQDMTLMSGHNQRRYRGKKRTHNNQYLGPFINHEANRCIACYRCVRFYRDYCGGDDLNVFASRNRVYFGRAEEGVLESEFSGNLAEVCPTGVFTDKTLSAHHTRKWDLESAPSICTHCSVGCNIYPAEHKGKMRRVQNRFHPEINGHFLCDRGRFGYGFVNDANRLTAVWKRSGTSHATVKLATKEAVQELATLLRNRSSIAIGSARSSLENNFALLEKMEADYFFAGIPKEELRQCHTVSELARQNLLALIPTAAIENADAALVIGEDPTQTAPVIALSLRQMAKNAGRQKAKGLGVQIWQNEAVRTISQNLKSPIHILGNQQSRLHDMAASEICLTPAAQAARVNRINQLLNNPESPRSNDDPAAVIADSLSKANSPVIITGAGSGDAALFAATIELAQTLYRLNNKAGFVFAPSQANSMGVATLAKPEHHLEGALARIDSNPPEVLFILETDLYRYFPADTIDKALDKVKTIVVFDHLLTPTAQMADLLLPTASVSESHGGWVNHEGRLQPALAVLAPAGERKAAWEWIAPSCHLTELVNRMAGQPGLQGIADIYPKNSSGFRIARKTIKATGRSASYAVADIREYPPAKDADSAYNFSSEGVTSLQLGKTDSPPAYLWNPGWNSNEALGHFQQGIDSPIAGTHPGLRLFAGNGNTREPNLPVATTSVSRHSTDSLLVLPLNNLFTDEELSSRVACIQERAPALSLRMNSKTAAKKQLCSGVMVAIRDTARCEKLPLCIDDSIPDDAVLLPAPLIAQFHYPVVIEAVK